MAAAEILAVGSTSADSSDVTVTTTPLAVSLKGSTPNAEVLVKLKDDAGGYNIIRRLTHDSPYVTLSIAGVYRFTRVAGNACGVFSG